MASTDAGRERRLPAGRLLLASVLLICLIATGQDSVDRVRELYSDLGTIRGRVYPAEDPELISPGMRTFALYRDDFSRCGFVVTLDVDGHYAVRLTSGLWRMSYLWPRVSDWLEAMEPGQARTITVEANEQHVIDVATVDYEDAPVSVDEWTDYFEQLTVIRGRVSIRSERNVVPYSNGSFLLQRLDFGKCVFEVVLDREGRYSIPIIPGRYRVLAHEITPSGEFVDVLAPGQAREIDVPLNRTVSQDFDIELLELESISP